LPTAEYPATGSATPISTHSAQIAGRCSPHGWSRRRRIQLHPLSRTARAGREDGEKSAKFAFSRFTGSDHEPRSRNPFQIGAGYGIGGSTIACFVGEAIDCSSRQSRCRIGRNAPYSGPTRIGKLEPGPVFLKDASNALAQAVPPSDLRPVST
jgi:hypothetical protein